MGDDLMAKIILKWIVDETIVERAVTETEFKISEEDVEVILQLETQRFRNVDLGLIRRYFDVDAWNLVTHLVGALEERGWRCRECDENLGEDDIRGCDLCLDWYHYN